MRSQSRYYGCLPSRGTSWVPRLRSPLLPSPVITNARCFHKGYLVRIYRLFLTLSMCSLTVHLADTRPHSPTTVAYESIARTSFIGSTYAIHRKADHLHVRIAFFHSSFVNLAHIASRFLIAFFPDDTLNPPSPRRHVLVAGIAVSTTGHHSSSSSKHHPRSIIICS